MDSQTQIPETKASLSDATTRLVATPTAAERQATERKQRFVLMACVAAVALAVALTWWFSSRNTTQDSSGGSAIATVRRADFLKKLRVNGTVEAVSYQPIAAPRLSGPGSGTLIITKLATSGSRVQKG